MLIAVLGLALTTNISNLWSTYEYGKTTIRAKSELTLGQEENQTSDGTNFIGALEGFIVLIFICMIASGLSRIFNRN